MIIMILIFSSKMYIWFFKISFGDYEQLAPI